jgi:hypothetical protein
MLIKIKASFDDIWAILLAITIKVDCRRYSPGVAHICCIPCSIQVPRPPTEKEIPEISRVFPSVKVISHQHPFLVLVVEKLPEQPWPMFLADLPLWLTTDSGRPPFDMGL